tara:strand:+ start:479 stop:739 length:261 start_codon:yes stop_codon:yes gene_type:complete
LGRLGIQIRTRTRLTLWIWLTVSKTTDALTLWRYARLLWDAPLHIASFLFSDALEEAVSLFTAQGKRGKKTDVVACLSTAALAASV